MGWVEDEFNTGNVDTSNPSTGWIQQSFGASEPVSRGQTVPGIPYPVAPEDVFGIPENAKASGVTRFFEELPGVLSDVGEAALPTESGAKARSRLRENDRQLSKMARSVVEDYAPLRMIGRAGVTAGTQLQNALVLRPVQIVGNIANDLGLSNTIGERAGQIADEANNFLQAMTEQDAVKARKSWLAAIVGPDTSQTVERFLPQLGANVMELVGTTGLAGPLRAETTFAPLLMSAEGADRKWTEIHNRTDLSTPAKILYASTYGAFEGAFMRVFGKAAENAGVRTLEESVIRGMGDVAASTIEKSGVNKSLQELTRLLSGAGFEATEEAATELGQIVTDEIYAESDKPLLSRLSDTFKSEETANQILLAGTLGAAGTGVIGALHKVGQAIDKIDPTVQALSKEFAQEAKRVEPEPPPEPEPAAPQPESEAPGPTAESEAEVGAPPAEPTTEPRTAPSDGDPVPPGIRTQNASMVQLAKKFGREDYLYSPQRKKFREAAIQATQAGLPEDVPDIARSILDTPRQLSPLEDAAFNLRLKQMEQDLDRTQTLLEQAESEGNTDSVTRLSHQLETIRTNFDLVIEATHQAGTEWGREGAYRRAQLQMDTELSTILARMRTAAKKPLSPKQKQAAEGLAKKGRQLDKGLAEATQKQHEQVVEEFIKESKQSPIPKEDIADVEDRIRTLLEENCDLE